MQRRRLDTQKSKVYRAENEVRAAVGDKAIKDRIAAWAFIEKVERDKWFRRHYGYRHFAISDGRGTSIARGGGNWLNLPRWSRTPMIMLHEIAHCVAPAGSKHNWPYCKEYLALVRHFLGKEIHAKLKASFKKHRVRHRKPKVLKPETLAALRARAANMRLAAKPQSAEQDAPASDLT